MICNVNVWRPDQFLFIVVNIKKEVSNYYFLFQVCIRVNEEKYYDFDPLHVYGTYHELYHYNEIDCKHAAKIPGLKLQSKIVRHALETVKEIKEVSSTLQRKVSEIKKESKEMYKNLMDERYPDEIDHHHPNTPSSPFSESVSNESLKQVQSELMKQIKGFQDAESERFSKLEETLKNTQDAERENFSKMEETFRNSLGAERERFSKLEETLGKIQGSLDAERERFSKLEETLRTCIQDSLQKQA